jgi:hypothetical protein
MTANRRRFSRILFQVEATLETPGGSIPVRIADLSLRGALVRPDPPAYVGVGTACSLRFALDDPEAVIRMEATVVHHEGEHFGLACREIDLDSMTHLRRLVELNLGDMPLLNRELNALTRPE